MGAGFAVAAFAFAGAAVLAGAAFVVLAFLGLPAFDFKMASRLYFCNFAERIAGWSSGNVIYKINLHENTIQTINEYTK